MYMNTRVLEHLLSIPALSVLSFMDDERKRVGITDMPETDHDNYWYLPGNIPVCLVAHVDTVRDEYKWRGKKKKGKYVFDPIDLVFERGIYKNKSGILGADDRAGCYVLWYYMLQGENKPHVLFTNHEESGGQGVKAFLREYDNMLKMSDIRLFIEIDRRGVSEYVTYNTIPNEVHKYVKSFGFHEGMGSFSDIMYLTQDTGIPSVNLSAGYYNEHSSREMLCVDELRLTVERIDLMLSDPIDQRYPVVERSRSMSSSSYWDNDSWDEQVGYMTTLGRLVCMKCGEKITDEDTDPVYDILYEDEVYDSDYCEECGDPLLPLTFEGGLTDDDDKEETSGIELLTKRIHPVAV